MGRHAYSFLRAHSEEHKHLLRALESVEKMHSSGEMPADRPVVQFIWDWLNDHVKSSDQQYAAFVRGRA
jgi:hemerythrin